MTTTTHPAPEIMAHVVGEHELPSAARKIAVLARQYQWTLRFSHARGTVLGSDRVVDSHLIRMTRPGSQLAAVWLDGEFEMARQRENFFTKVSAADLLDLIKTIGTTGQESLFCET